MQSGMVAARRLGEQDEGITMTEAASPITRRRLLQNGVGGAALLSVPGLLSACGGDDKASVRTGPLRVAAPGAGSDNLDPLRGTEPLDFLVALQLFDELARLDGDKVELALAESIEPNADATEWTIRVRDGVRFHDGTPLTARDVAYSLRLLGDPERNQGATLFSDLDLSKLKVVDDRTLRLPLKRARGDLVDGILALTSTVFPAGLSDFSNAVGSGPFKLVSFRPGTPVELARNADYWDGAPQIRELEIRAISDPVARLNAVKGGQIDYAIGITPTGAKSAQRGRNLQVVRSGARNSSALMFVMNETRPPFDDPRVRLAFRLAIDRQALVDSVLLGEGEIGNDIPGKGLLGYAGDLPQRTRDVDRARNLLAAAGVTKVTMRAADVQPGLVDAAALYARQLEEVGVKLTIDKAPADSYFDDFERVLSTPFQTFFAYNRPAAVNIAAFNGSNAAFNVAGIGDREFDGKLAEAQATVDGGQRTQGLKEVQRILHERGGEIIWGFAETLDVSRIGVEGVQQTTSGVLFSKVRFT